MDAKAESVIIFHDRLIWRLKLGPKRGWNSKFSIKIIHVSISIILGMPNLNLPLFFISDPLGGLKLGSKRGVKFKVFDWNNSYIDFNIFGDAESEPAIIFHVQPMWGLKLGPKWGLNSKFSTKFSIEIIYISISIILGMPNLNLPLFFMSDPSGG